MRTCVNYSSFERNTDTDAKKLGIDNIKASSTVVIPVTHAPNDYVALLNKNERCKEIIVDQYLKQNYFNSIQIYTDE